jgi:cysteine desulfurase
VDTWGRVDPDAVEAALRPETLLISIMHANNETGVLQPVAEVCRRARDRGLLVHVDGVQAAGRIPVDVQALGCDLYSVSAHKLGGLKGAGALYVRDRQRLEWVQQGGHQEHGLRAGTENVPGIVALGKAAEIARRDLESSAAACLASRRIFEELVHRLPLTRLNGHPSERLPNTVNLCCLYADAMSVVLALSAMGIFVGTGSACASHAQAPSHVLRAMGLSAMAALCSLRISTGAETDSDQAQQAADAIAATVERVRLVTAPEQIGTCDDNCPCYLDAGTGHDSTADRRRAAAHPQ